MEVKSVVLFDEINLAPGDVLSTLISLLNANESYVRIKDMIINKN